MSRDRVYTIFFFLAVLMGLAIVLVADADPEEIAKLRAEIASLTHQLHWLNKSLETAESELAAAAADLAFLEDRRGKVGGEIATAYEGLMAADNDVERELWSALLTILQNHQEWVENEYYWTSYTIYMLEFDIESLNDEIEFVEASLAVANARLAELLE